jgi:membrane fusion protein (multidrug efflux system)
MLRYIRKHKWRVLPAANFLLAVLLTGGCKPENKPASASAPEVRYMVVQPTNVPVTEDWIGTLDGLVNAQIRAQVTGYLQTMNYAEGSRVKKGDLLFQIDDRPFKATLDQVVAKLAQDKAVQAKTELDVKRYEPLVREQALSQETLDNAVQANLAAKALVVADEAAIESARLNFDWTKISSPVDGVAGIALGQIGDLVGSSGPLLTTVSTVDPIKVYFQVNEHSYLTFWQKYVSTMDTNAADLSLELILTDGSVYGKPGRFFSADRQVNATTGTLQIVAVFPNPDYTLRPGQYGRVQAVTGRETNVFVIPQRAVTQLQSIYQVSVVGPSNMTHLQPVKVGRQIGADWIVQEGLKSGDRLVVEGLQKAGEGKVVTPKLAGMPESNSISANLASTNSAH